QPLRSAGGSVRTPGLSDDALAAFQNDAALKAAVEAAVAAFARVRIEYPELIDMDEEAQLRLLQADFVNFYPDDAINPYVAIAASGPWIVTLKGAVIHDSGGYGMLGLGHTPAAVIEAMAQP